MFFNNIAKGFNQLFSLILRTFFHNNNLNAKLDLLGCNYSLLKWVIFSMSKFDIGVEHTVYMRKLLIFITLILTTTSVLAFEYGYTDQGFKYVKHEQS